MLDAEANPRVFTRRGNGATPLHLAAVKGHAEVR
jgi:ankyrin repeat protein